MERNFKETRKYLDTFINYEKSTNYVYKKDLKLKRVKFLFRVLQIPYGKLKAIHIAGTKGKGSSATFIAYILAKQGFRVGLYTSPHFIDLRERIRILESKGKKVLNTMIPKREVVRIIGRFKPHLEKIRFTERFGRITFFEVYTALAFKYFLDKNLDYVVLEVGLGGRFDATNVVNPLVSVITHIGYDHTQKLGRHIKDIAYEKAGIIKKKIAVVVSHQKKEALEVIYKRAKEMNSPLYVLNKDFHYHNIKLGRTYAHFDFTYRRFILKDICISLKGMHQIDNASLAIMTVYLIQKYRNKITFKEGLKEAHIEGRFEIISRDPFILVDIAHNPSSFKALRKSLDAYFPKKKIILIFAASSDKDVKKMLSLFDYEKLILTSFNNPRSFTPHEIVSLTGVEADIACNLKSALKRAYTYYNKECIIVISGSFFLVAEAKKIFKK